MEKTETATQDIRVEKYKGTRYWSVWLGEELLAVTVYKKGAMAIKQILTSKKSSAYAQRVVEPRQPLTLQETL